MTKSQELSPDQIADAIMDLAESVKNGKVTIDQLEGLHAAMQLYEEVKSSIAKVSTETTIAVKETIPTFPSDELTDEEKKVITLKLKELDETLQDAVASIGNMGTAASKTSQAEVSHVLTKEVSGMDLILQGAELEGIEGDTPRAQLLDALTKTIYDTYGILVGLRGIKSGKYVNEGVMHDAVGRISIENIANALLQAIRLFTRVQEKGDDTPAAFMECYNDAKDALTEIAKANTEERKKQGYISGRSFGESKRRWA